MSEPDSLVGRLVALREAILRGLRGCGPFNCGKCDVWIAVRGVVSDVCSVVSVDIFGTRPATLRVEK